MVQALLALPHSVSLLSSIARLPLHGALRVHGCFSMRHTDNAGNSKSFLPSNLNYGWRADSLRPVETNTHLLSLLRPFLAAQRTVAAHTVAFVAACHQLSTAPPPPLRLDAAYFRASHRPSLLSREA
jgi:hypothetical protein